MSTENIPMYYYSENGEVVGPFTVQELAGKITPDSMVVSENATKWVKAIDVPEISEILFVQQPDEAKDFTPEELEVKDYSLSELVTENLEIVTPSAPVNYSNNTNHVVTANQNIAKPRLWILLISIVLLLVVIGGSVFFYLKSDYYKWKSAVKMYNFTDELYIRSDTITTVKGEKYKKNLDHTMTYGDSVLVLDNPLLAPWVDVKYGDKLGHVNGSFLMSENEFKILESILDTKDKKVNIKNGDIYAKYRKSLVNYIIEKSKLNSISELSWSIEPYFYTNYCEIIKKKDGGYADAIILKLKNPTSSEYVIFVYNGNNEINKHSIPEPSYGFDDDFSYLLNQYNLGTTTESYD